MLLINGWHFSLEQHFIHNIISLQVLVLLRNNWFITVLCLKRTFVGALDQGELARRIAKLFPVSTHAVYPPVIIIITRSELASLAHSFINLSSVLHNYAYAVNDLYLHICVHEQKAS